MKYSFFLLLFFILYVRNRCGHRRLLSGRIEVVSVGRSLETRPDKTILFRVWFRSNGTRQNEHDSNEARGGEKKCRSGVKRGLKVMRMWPLGLRFFEVFFLVHFSVLFLFSSLSLSLFWKSIFSHRASPKRERLPFRPLILSVSNFECEQRIKKKESRDVSARKRKDKERQSAASSAKYKPQCGGGVRIKDRRRKYILQNISQLLNSLVIFTVFSKFDRDFIWTRVNRNK